MPILKKWGWIPISPTYKVRCDGYCWILQGGPAQTFHSSFKNACIYMIDKRIGESGATLQEILTLLAANSDIFDTLKEEIGELRDKIKSMEKEKENGR